jgi:hypothetical protein
MKRTTVILAGIIALACLFALAPNAEAKPEFWSLTPDGAQNCTMCHTSPDPGITCDGCHFHGPANLAGATDKTSYTPGETVSVTISGGDNKGQGGWVRFLLYDENGNQIASSSAGQTGGANTGYDHTFTAPAPNTPGTYQWEVAWFGNMYDKNNTTPWTHGEERAATNSFDVSPLLVCTDGDGDSFNAEGGECGTTDCDDTDSFVFPGAGEDCTDGIDNDCDGLVDTQDLDAINCPPVCTDGDGDNYSLEGGECGPVDCNDTDPAVNPGAIESCTDGIDNNCNGKVDDADPGAVECPPSCTDSDQDGFNLEGGECGLIDCNDGDPLTSPGAGEICDGADNDCDGQVDEGFDADQDGVTVCEGDCDEGDALVFPGATENCSDGIDNDCDQLVDADDPGAVACGPNCTDSDQDGFALEGGECGPVDCSDSDPAVNPDATESCSDGIDNNCNLLVDIDDPVAVGCGPDCTDSDQDGFSLEGGDCGPVDCNDGDALVNPAADEDCSDGIDNNCDQLVDADDPVAVGCGPDCTDSDQDGFNLEGGDCGPVDCDDNDALTSPDAPEICDGVDNDCNGQADEGFDADQDGVTICEGDCDDGDALVFPGAAENCGDGIDNDCDQLVDVDDPGAVGCGPDCTDIDQDGFSLEGGECGPVDCNDGDPLINPGAVEDCTDGGDNNCNGLVDTLDSAAAGCSTNCVDGDGDGYAGDESEPPPPVDLPPVDPPTSPHDDGWKKAHRSQASPSEAATCALCHQSNFDLEPSCFNNTLCHGGDGDDSDSEGNAPPNFTIAADECGPVDCNDGDIFVNPGAGEDCNDGVDNDCNGLVDDADPVCAEDLTDYDIKKFKAKKKAKVGKKLKIQVQVQNRGPGGGSAIVNVYGMMGETYIPVASDLLVSISKKKGISKHKFYYYPDTPGQIIWHAEVTDGDADTDHKTSKSKVK